MERRTGIHNAHLSQIETGTIERPAPNVLWALAEVYDLDLRDLLRMSGHVEAAANATPGSVVGAALRTMGETVPRASSSRSWSSWRISRRERALDSNLAGELARRQILAFTDSALRNAGVTGIIPTPLDAVAKAAGITEIIDISQPAGRRSKRASRPR